MIKKWLFLLVWMFPMQAKIIFWDLGGTLVETHKLSMMQELGWLDFLLYYFWYSPTKKHLENRVYETLIAIGGNQEFAAEIAPYSTGLSPKILHGWFIDDAESCEELIVNIEYEIDRLYMQGFFVDAREYRIIRKSIRALMSPEKLVYMLRPISKMFDILASIDKNQHTVMMFSNWDGASFRLLQKTALGQKLLTHFQEDKLVISGFIGKAKPHLEFFKHVLETYNLNPADCIFIDDNAHNIAVAQLQGIKGILYTGNAHHVKNELMNFDIFK